MKIFEIFSVLPKYHTAKLFCKVKASLFSSFENTTILHQIFILQPFIKSF
jgi:hypothetical protein